MNQTFNKTYLCQGRVWDYFMEIIVWTIVIPVVIQDANIAYEGCPESS